MKVKCIKLAPQFQITVGGEYKLESITNSGYIIYNPEIDHVYEYPKEYFEIAQETSPITYKDFLASMPKSASAAVTMYGDEEVIANVYGFEFACKTEERAEEVYAALITLFKE